MEKWPVLSLTPISLGSEPADQFPEYSNQGSHNGCLRRHCEGKGPAVPTRVYARSNPATT